jgi:glycosyltransferase involved in cell wall biosynthesis
VVYDTTDPTLFSPIDYDVKISDPIVGFIGDIYYRDGVDVLIKAMAIVNKEMPNVKLYLVGDGPDKNRILKIAHRIGIEKNLVITGWLPFRKVVDLLHKMIIGVAPARPLLMNRLVIPRKVYEYMSAGVVTIASDLEAIREIIEDKNSGFLVKSLNFEELAEAILHLLYDRKLYTRIQHQARKTIEELSVEREVGRIVTLIDNAT